MSENIFRGLTTRVQRGVWMDGINEICGGLFLFGVGVMGWFTGGLSPYSFWGPPFILLVMGSFAWLLHNYLKTSFSHPRLGYMKPARGPLFPDTALFIIVYGPLFVWVSRSPLVDRNSFITFMVIVATSHAVVAGILARAPRFFLHFATAILVLMFMTKTEAFLLVLGAVWLFSGAMVFAQFLRNHPEVNEDDSHA
ncbi:MAG: hypothetical protein Q8S19_03210 [Bacillota bacterium]|nr:hypothetical protein [Bacillota bacterium]